MINRKAHFTEKFQHFEEHYTPGSDIEGHHNKCYRYLVSIIPFL